MLAGWLGVGQLKVRVPARLQTRRVSQLSDPLPGARGREADGTEGGQGVHTELPTPPRARRVGRWCTEKLLQGRGQAEGSEVRACTLVPGGGLAEPRRGDPGPG